MEKAERFAMVDVAKDEIEYRLGYELTDEEWAEIVENVYDDAKETFLSFVEDMAEEMECENAPVE
jgi:hypothetical protein